MPRAPRTQLLLKREKIQKEIKYLKECIAVKEGELEEVMDIINKKGPFLREPYYGPTKRNGRVREYRNANAAMSSEQF